MNAQAKLHGLGDRWILGGLRRRAGDTSARHARAPAVTAGISLAEQARTIEGLKPPKRARPVVAVLGHNDGTEVTDFVIPYGVLRHSGLAEVIALAADARPIKLYPGFTIKPQATIAEFDARFRDGADYVVVPAMQPRDDATVVAWIASQAAKGATIVSICNGAKTLAAAGLLRERAATAHWNDIKDLRDDNPSMRWVPDRRYVVDRGVVTSTGVSSSIPVSLAVVEAIGGRARAEHTAQELGVQDWDARHDSAVFELNRAHGRTAVRNMLAFWKRETVGVRVDDGVDEIALALTIDAYSRTYRSRAVSVSSAPSVTTRRGLELIPEKKAPAHVDWLLPGVPIDRAALAMETSLIDIARRYDEATAALVALQLEFAWPRQTHPLLARLPGHIARQPIDAVRPLKTWHEKP